ncbi:carbonic anhydrase domain-containing protein [Trichoderma breve]|uniref:Carbonic anhydrase n=1 Tax=Trichoderma breve TaxID=2034170 RepID=A0A9W9B595_9HYPO|nr:carbonic anhydrase domain-containing protein [Trichoderma breve]KAJ4856662.1 carbonic anhydrase domain-containing protein [Trichoderma breve]
MTVASEFEVANQQYVATFDKADLPMPPGRKVFVLTCMDARLDPAKFLGLEEGHAHVYRNAGGRAAEALRSLIISQQALGTEEVVVIHHTDCGMLLIHEEEFRNTVKKNTGEDVSHVAFLTIQDLQKSVKTDVELLRKNAAIKNVPISGYIFDVKTGKINKVDI